MKKIITKIEVGKRDKKRVNIFLDEEFAFACSVDLVYYYNLNKGKSIDENYLKEIVEEDNYLKGKNYALKVIERNYKTEKEVIDKLIRKEYKPEIIERIIEFLKEYNFINDEKYCEMFIREKISSCGRNKIKYLLMKKGIKGDIIDTEMRKIHEDHEDIEKDNGFKVAEKKYNIIIKSESDPVKIYRKLSQYLANRGYMWEDIKKILKEIMKNE